MTARACPECGQEVEGLKCPECGAKTVKLRDCPDCGSSWLTKDGFKQHRKEVHGKDDNRIAIVVVVLIVLLIIVGILKPMNADAQAGYRLWFPVAPKAAEPDNRVGDPPVQLTPIP